jgi:hypothetical protein
LLKSSGSNIEMRFLTISSHCTDVPFYHEYAISFEHNRDVSNIDTVIVKSQSECVISIYNHTIVETVVFEICVVSAA